MYRTQPRFTIYLLRPGSWHLCVRDGALPEAAWISHICISGRIDDIKDHLEKGRPLIVALKPSTGDATLHYVVVVGLDPDARLGVEDDPQSESY